MVKKYITLLKNQLEKLEREEFDFEAWKTSTVIILTRIFGPADVKIKQLESLRVEYGSSWSMRAVSGSFDPISSSKKQGREIVEVAINELELYGEEILSPCGQLVEDSLSEVLTVADYKALQGIITEQDAIKKNEALNKFLKKLSKDELTMVLTHILSEQK